MRRLKRSVVAAAVFGLGFAITVPASKAQQAADSSFLVGTYSTAGGCKMVDALRAGTPRGLATVPDTLDAKGFHGWEGGCEFTKVWVHKPGSIWAALMFCSEGNSAGPQIFTFAKNPETNTFDVSSIGQQDPEVFYSCDARDKKKGQVT